MELSKFYFNRGLIIAVVIILFLLMVSGGCELLLTRPFSANQELPKSESMFIIGSQSILHNIDPDLTTVPVASEWIYWEDYLKAIMANDKTGINELIIQNKLMPIDNGTRVLILDEYSLSWRYLDLGDLRKIRILEVPESEYGWGKGYIGKTGWTAAKFFSPVSNPDE